MCFSAFVLSEVLPRILTFVSCKSSLSEVVSCTLVCQSLLFCVSKTLCVEGSTELWLLSFTSRRYQAMRFNEFTYSLFCFVWGGNPLGNNVFNNVFNKLTFNLFNLFWTVNLFYLYCGKEVTQIRGQQIHKLCKYLRHQHYLASRGIRAKHCSVFMLSSAARMTCDPEIHALLLKKTNIVANLLIALWQFII